MAPAAAPTLPAAATATAVAQILSSAGYAAAEPAALRALTDLAARHLCALARAASARANALNRTQPNLLDLTLALELLSLPRGFPGASLPSSPLLSSSIGVLKEIIQFVGSIKEIPFAKPIRVLNCDQFGANFDQFGEDPTWRHVPRWLPRFPDMWRRPVGREVGKRAEFGWKAVEEPETAATMAPTTAATGTKTGMTTVAPTRLLEVGWKALEEELTETTTTVGTKTGMKMGTRMKMGMKMRLCEVGRKAAEEPATRRLLEVGWKAMEEELMATAATAAATGTSATTRLLEVGWKAMEEELTATAAMTAATEATTATSATTRLLEVGRKAMEEELTATAAMAAATGAMTASSATTRLLEVGWKAVEEELTAMETAAATAATIATSATTRLLEVGWKAMEEELTATAAMAAAAGATTATWATSRLLEVGRKAVERELTATAMMTTGGTKTGTKAGGTKTRLLEVGRERVKFRICSKGGIGEGRARKKVKMALPPSSNDGQIVNSSCLELIPHRELLQFEIGLS